ncbi:hypothetical protein [Flammeovirga pacifica]|uniref:DUF4157 domain-containing protein n=1 Tax=Flammeovirga pacifica TaxID=915059 RepID=A0A1S1YZQ0_FLAPC|nr:hypothetical protein [Flammeovirga pacifica]OHX66478.1 hypothetical protein NH26_08975 [Flammeovirga pacifica]
MRIIFNNTIPFKGFIAMAVYPFVFVRSEYKTYQHSEEWNRMIRHEKIHFAQQKELLLITFYFIYFIHFVFLFVIHKNVDKAYRSICFEREAYQNEKNRSYLSTRKRFSWLKYLKR